MLVKFNLHILHSHHYGQSWCVITQSRIPASNHGPHLLQSVWVISYPVQGADGSEMGPQGCYQGDMLRVCTREALGSTQIDGRVFRRQDSFVT